MPRVAETRNPARREAIAVLLVAAVVVALAALRACVGQSFFDDSFYVAVPWRFAHGARFLVDELSFQTIAEMISVPVVWVWERLYGVTGLVLAVRVFWIALATAGAALATRLLRGTARVGVVAFAVALPLLAPAYHVFSPTYNTLSSLLLSLGAVLAFASLRKSSRALSYCTGACAALGAAAYPPLAAAALVLLLTYALMSRSWALAWRAFASAVAVGAIASVALLGGVSLTDIRLALAFGSANVASFSAPLGKFEWVLGNTGWALITPWLWPMWALALLACVPGSGAKQVRASALALVPLAAGLPAIPLLARGDHLTFGTSAQSWLITLCAGVVVPALLGAYRTRQRDLLQLCGLAAPFSAVGYATVAYVTNSSWNRGMPAVALAPLAIGILLCWGATIAKEGGGALFSIAAVLALVVAFALLFSSVFGDDGLWRQPAQVQRGAYAGLITSASHVKALDELANQATQRVTSTMRVAFLGQAEAYLSVGGKPLTPATWLFLGPADSAGIDYFKRVRRTPDVVFVDDFDVSYEGGYARAPAKDPMLRWVLANYRRAARAGGFSVFVKP